MKINIDVYTATDYKLITMNVYLICNYFITAYLVIYI